jgi:hypothetical protein
MFLAVAARPRYAFNKKAMWDGIIGIWECVDLVPAKKRQIWKRVPGLEDFPLIIQQSQLGYFFKMADHDDAKNELELWHVHHKEELARAMSFPKNAHLTWQIRDRAFAGNQLFQANEEKTNLTDYINQLVAKERQLRDVLSDQKGALPAASMLMLEQEKNHSFESFCAIVQQDLLQPQGIQPANYHGGKMVGPSYKA